MNAPAETSRLNPGQRAALDLDRDLLVDAGAGAGKTQVLGLRFVAALETGRARVAEMVAFTFTDKAAAEMRDRVQLLLARRVNELLAQGTSTAALANLQRAQREFHQNHISTVHSFCHRLLAEYAWEAGLEPGARILPERDQRSLRDEAVRRVLLNQSAEPDPELEPALRTLGTAMRYGALRELLQRALAERAVIGRALENAARAWAQPEREIERRRRRLARISGLVVRPVLVCLKKLDLGAVRGATAGDTLREKVVAVAAAAVSDTPWPALQPLLLTKGGDPRSFGKAGAKDKWKHAPHAMQDTRDVIGQAANLLAEQAEVLGAYVFDESHERRAGEALKALTVVFSRLLPEYERACAGALDFLDLELRAIALLREQPETRHRVAGGIRLLLVDEFQDTNPVQAELFALLRDADATPGRFFAVGDAKQSIYGFRGSDVSLFFHAAREVQRRNQRSGAAARPPRLPWQLAGPDTPEVRNGLVRLAANYRTVPPVLELGNRLFERLLRREYYRDFDARPQDMTPGRDPVRPGRPLAELHLLPMPSNVVSEKEDNDDEEPGAVGITADQATWVAGRVLALRSQGVALKDIAILVRRGTKNHEYRQAFNRAGLPLLVMGETGLLGTQEACDCLNLLRVLANTRDEAAVLGLLRSPFAAVSDRTLTELALDETLDRKGGLLGRARGWQQQRADQRLGEFLPALDALLARAGHEPPAVLLAEALSRFGYLLAVSTGPGSEQRVANVQALQDLVRATQARFPSLAPLVRELRARAEDNDEPQGKPDSDADGVRLMTIHKAKGLEFPVVIIPQMGDKRHKAASGALRHLPARATHPLGLWLPSMAEHDRGKSRPDYAAWRAGLAAREREEAEALRVFYVAYTRAKERVIMVGTMGEEIRPDSWAGRLLRGLGIEAWHENSTDAGLSLHWHDSLPVQGGLSNQAQLARVHAALQSGRLPVPTAVDDTLAAVAARPEPASWSDPQAGELGTLVHAGIERAIRVGSIEAGVVDARAAGHVRNALQALRTLRPAVEIPEHSLVHAGRTLRLDLLRKLSDTEYEIVDYKTDRVEGDLKAAAESRHGQQLRAYAVALKAHLAARSISARVRLLVCFTAPENLQPEQRLVEIAEC
ncbi:MAG: UvrD-helicase domain-containing protein [Planctomycetes bacterium]|nr:UvrD-helicase domain-containing protein [Planctomycetota bacterium]